MSSHDTALDPSHLISRDITLVRCPELQDEPLGDHLVVRDVNKDKFFTQNTSVELSKQILTFFCIKRTSVNGTLHVYFRLT